MCSQGKIREVRHIRKFQAPTTPERHVLNTRTPVALVVLVLTTSAHAQSDKPLTILPRLTLQTEWRLRGEERINNDFNNLDANNPHDSHSRLRLGFSYKGDGYTAFLQPQWAVVDNTHWANATGTHHDLDIHQGFVDIKSAYGRWRLGRQEMLFGDARLIGNGNWSAIGRSFDGARLTLSDKRTSTDVFATVLGHAYPKTNQPVLAGVYGAVRRSPSLSYDVYALYKTMPVTAATNQQIVTIGTRPVWVPARRVDTKLEAVYQFGTNEARPVSAWAYAIVAGYTFPGRAGLRVGIERDAASGGNPTGTGTYQTFDQIFPTNHQHYGIIDLVGWRNMEDWRITASAKPADKLTVQLDGHFFSLQNAHDFWYGDGGRTVVNAAGKPFRDPTGAAGKDLGVEFDAQATYRLSKMVSLGAGYARFVPGDFVKATNGGRADTSDWFYLMAELKF
jgi:hypothetical protein